jgi:hypothetical protein
MTQVWQPGTTYVPGSLARPTGGPQQVQTYPLNNLFEDGLTGWTVSGASGWSAVTDKVYDGTKSAKYIGNGISALVNNVRAPVTPGQQITAFCVISLDHNTTDVSAGRIQIYWFDASNTFISATSAPVISVASHGVWQQSLVTGTAPNGAAFASIAISANADASSFTRVDGTGWYYTYGGPPDGLVYKAVQAAPGKSGSTEPTWPPTLGVTVVDNQVTWEAVLATQIVWTARAINKSGDTEPTWPGQLSGTVHDGTIDWIAKTPAVEDPKCPNSIQVAIASGKVFAGDKDITRYSATMNPLDWTTPEDAGFIAHGLQSVQEPNVTCLNVYRGNLAILTASNIQLWKADPDPLAILILDTVESVGTTYNRGGVPVSQDVFFVSQQGIRSISVSASQEAMGEGDIGNPVDTVVRELLGADSDPVAVFFPNLGHSLFFFGNQALVLFQNKLAKITGWAIYTLPINVTDAAVLDGDLYVRNATDIYWMDVGSKADFGGAFQVVLEWQYLDFGKPGSRKTFMGVSMESDATGTVSAAYAIQDTDRRTGEKRLPRKGSDAFMSMSFVAKQAAFRLTFDSDAMDSFTRATVYFQDGGTN